MKDRGRTGSNYLRLMKEMRTYGQMMSLRHLLFRKGINLNIHRVAECERKRLVLKDGASHVITTYVFDNSVDLPWPSRRNCWEA